MASAIACASAEPLVITATPLSSFAALGPKTDLGKFVWKGGLVLTSEKSTFGGLSGLILRDDCRSLLAVSDAGRWIKARMAYDGDGAPIGLEGAEIAPMLDARGKPPRAKIHADAEALADLGRGKVLVGFESQTRIGLYDIGRSGLKARYEVVKSPKAISEGPDNAELEAVGRLSAGRHAGYNAAISENNADGEGNIRAWLWKGPKTIPFSIARFEDYAITDLAVLADGNILTLERSFSRTSLPGMAIRRFSPDDVAPQSVAAPELVFSGRFPLYAIDNMEGLAICKMGGETRLTIVSDNNFNTGIQRTLLLQFAYEP
jgi:hypothetical protein